MISAGVPAVLDASNVTVVPPMARWGVYWRRTRQASLVGVCLHEGMIAARGITVGVFISYEPTQLNVQLQLLTTVGRSFRLQQSILAGAGRTGEWWAVNHSDVIPDLLVFAKGLGSGMPISGVATRSELVANQVHVHGYRSLTVCLALAGLNWGRAYQTV